MAMKMEYDEQGTTFYYFLISFLLMVIIPITYYLWPDESKKTDDDEESKIPLCQCPPCVSKMDKLQRKAPSKSQKYFIRAILLVCWAALIWGAWRVSQFEKEYKEYNPFDVLGIDAGATTKEIKKVYRQLSLQMHPDRGGDADQFIRIKKAYEALSDETARKNWEEHGDPDGPKAAAIGIALPSFLIDPANSHFVLGAYILGIIIILPIVVGSWWYKSIQYSADEVLMGTEQLFQYYLMKTPNMAIHRILMILAGAYEFWKEHNKEIIERPSDNKELPFLKNRIVKDLKENNKDQPLCYAYAFKARILLFAHLERLEMPQNSIGQDLELILKKSPALLKEMMNIVTQFMLLARQGRVHYPANLSTIENLVKVNQMLVQGLWEADKPFLMLPHIEPELLRHFKTKKRSINSIKQFVSMKNDERRLLLRSLSDEQYADVINACWSFPHLDIDVKVRVIDEDEPDKVTSGAIVTAVLKLERRPLGEFFEDETSCELPIEEKEEEEDAEKETKWKPKQKKKGGGAKKPVKKQQPKKKKDEKKVEELAEVQEETSPKKKRKRAKAATEDQDEENDADSEEDAQGVEEIDEDSDVASDAESDGGDSDDSDTGPGFNELNDDDLIQPDKLLQVKSKESHIVHSPHYPAEKHEYWWVYIVTKPHNKLTTIPTQVTSLKDVEEVQLKFTAPEKVGIHHYTMWVRSDSYVDFDVYKNFKVEVSAAKEFDPGTHWDYSSDEEGKEESGESVYETEDEEEGRSDSEEE